MWNLSLAEMFKENSSGDGIGDMIRFRWTIEAPPK